MVILQVKDLTKKFGGLVAVNELNMEVKEGEIVGVIGPNGAGKTTLFNLISGYLKPTRGAIFFRDENITSRRPDIIAKKGITRNFQATVLYRELSVLENIVTAHYLKSATNSWHALINTRRYREDEENIHKYARGIIETMDLKGHEYTLAKNLPYGLQRVLGVAMALATAPALLLLDEPVSGMNPEESAHMMNTVKQIRDRGINIVVVEHNMKAVMSTCDRIVVLNYGSKIAEGTPKEIQENREVITAYLGTEEA